MKHWFNYDNKVWLYYFPFEYGNWSIANYWPSMWSNVIKNGYWCVSMDLIYLIVYCVLSILCATWRIVSLMYVSPRIQTPWSTLQAGWIHGSLSLKRVFDFLVSHFILMSYLSLVNLLNFLINCFEATPFLSQYRTSIKITGSLTSKKPGGVIKSIILWSFSLFRKSLHALSLNFDGKSAAMNFFLIFCSKPVAILFARCK